MLSIAWPDELLVDGRVDRLHLGELADVIGEGLRRCLELLALVSPGVGCRREDIAKAPEVVPRLGRQVRRGPERLAVGAEEHVERPATAAVDRDGDVHVQRVDVRPFLAIDLDADEALVHQLGGLRHRERLALHHVAPVAGGVADREEDRLPLLTCAGEGLVAPRVPVDRVLRVLQEVRARLVLQAVHGSKLDKRHHARISSCERGAGTAKATSAAVTTASSPSSAASSTTGPPPSRSARAPSAAKSPSASSTAPIMSSPATRTNGSQDCYIAWPTAPTRSTVPPLRPGLPRRSN